MIDNKRQLTGRGVNHHSLLKTLLTGGVVFSLTCCVPTEPADKNRSGWKEELQKALPLLGHRNWIVVTDMAYPLQAQPGIRTIYTGESYVDVLRYVYEEIGKAPHVKANVYQDKEFFYLDEEDVPGIMALREEVDSLFQTQVSAVAHEELIGRLDEVSRTFNVIVLKSKLAIPYTTTFFELDCKYWNSWKERVLQEKMNKS
ncbi:MAG: hypothetical protein LBC40_09395 [Dysgonamonadaceae bacterium]|jgi:hypothetical protein|nr:hypothetical protein [Dysgonamonadaceae bacterium]